MILHMTKTPDVRERFRTIPGQRLYFPENLNLDDYELFGYLLGNRVAKCSTLTRWHFECLEFVRFSKNPINGIKTIHVNGCNKGHDSVVLIFKLK